MNQDQIASLYRQTGARGSNPVGLVVKVYDAILEDFRRAINAANAGDIQARTSSLNHALQIIAELQSVLDHERGGVVAQRLDGFYSVTRSLVVEANIQGTPQHFQRLIDLYAPVRQAWEQVEREASAGQLNAGIRKRLDANQAATSREQSSTNSSEVPQVQWNA